MCVVCVCVWEGGPERGTISRLRNGLGTALIRIRHGSNCHLVGTCGRRPATRARPPTTTGAGHTPGPDTPACLSPYPLLRLVQVACFATQPLRSPAAAAAAARNCPYRSPRLVETSFFRLFRRLAGWQSGGDCWLCSQSLCARRLSPPSHRSFGFPGRPCFLPPSRFQKLCSPSHHSPRRLCAGALDF